MTTKINQLRREPDTPAEFRAAANGNRPAALAERAGDIGSGSVDIARMIEETLREARRKGQIRQ